MTNWTAPTYPRDQCAIAGIGASDFSRASGRSVLTLAGQAARAALEDAGIAPRAVDGIVRCENDSVAHNDLAHVLDVDELTYWGSVPGGGAAPAAMIGQAVAAIAAGLARTVVVFRSLNGRSGERYGRGVAHGAEEVGGNGSLDELFMPYGLLTPGQMWAMMFRRHQTEFGTSGDALAAIALAFRARANANPAAQMADRTMTRDDYDDAPMISTPLRRSDFCLETDGACALVVTATDVARDGPHPLCTIRAVAQSAPRGMNPAVMFPALLRTSLTTQPSAGVARALYRRAGLGPGDIDVAQFYDCFTPTVLMQVEDYGFCAKGEGGPFIEEGSLDLDGVLPSNTAGGNLSEGYIHGMTHIAEGVRQIRGTSTSQVAGASTCLVTSGLPIVSSALVLTDGSEVVST